MSEDIRLLSQIRTLPTLDQKFTLFADYMKSEHHYDAVTYVISLDTSSTENMLQTTIMKERGLQPEWMTHYINEQMARHDLALSMVYTRDKPILLGNLFNAAHQATIAPRFCAPPSNGFTTMPNQALSYR